VEIRAGKGCNLAPQNRPKGGKNPYQAIDFAVPQVVEKVIQSLWEKLTAI
jgi:hypothetical protein